MFVRKRHASCTAESGQFGSQWIFPHSTDLGFGQGNEAYAIKRDELPKALSEYFDKHDFVNYDVNDLWLEIGYDNLVSWHC